MHSTVAKATCVSAGKGHIFPPFLYYFHYSKYPLLLFSSFSIQLLIYRMPMVEAVFFCSKPISSFGRFIKDVGAWSSLKMPGLVWQYSKLFSLACCHNWR